LRDCMGSAISVALVVHQLVINVVMCSCLENIREQRREFVRDPAFL